jgi:hypothetical protein
MSRSKVSQDANENAINAVGNPTSAPLTNEAAPSTNGSAVGLSIGSQRAREELDIRQYRADQNYSLHVAAKKKAVVVPVVRPDRQIWIMVHPDPGWRAPWWLLEDKPTGRVYLMDPKIAPDPADDLKLKLLVAYVSISGAPGLWPIRLPDETGNIDTYNESALAIVSEHAGKWIRVLCDRSEKAYFVLESPPSIELPVPRWPEGGYDWMSTIAFRNRIIKTPEHPILMARRGALGFPNDPR